MQFATAAFKHGVSRDQILEVYASGLTRTFPDGKSEQGNERVMMVGFDMAGTLLEIGMELLPNDFAEDENEDEDEENFYHAMTATPYWRKKFEGK